MIQKLGRLSLVLYVIGSLTAMAPMNLSFLLVLLIAIPLFIVSQKKHSPPFQHQDSLPGFQSYRFWALALLITCWGSLVVTKFFPYAYAGHDPEVTFHGFLKIWYLLVPAIFIFVYENTRNSHFSLIQLIKPWWIATLILLGVAIHQFFTGWPQPQGIPTNPGYFHAILFFGHHLSTASIIIFPAFTALAIATGFYTRRNQALSKVISSSSTQSAAISSIPLPSESAMPLSPRFALVIGLAGTLILFLSYARTAWISLLIGFALLLKKYVLPMVSRKQWMAGGACILLALGLFSQTSLVKERIDQMMGVNERVELWKANIDFFVHRPITGIGWLKTQEMSEFYFKTIDPDHYRERFWGHAHSNIFEMLGGTGILGLLAFLGWSIFTLRFAHRLSSRFVEKGDFFYADFSFGIFIALILLHFNGLTNVTFWEGKVMHQQMLAVGMLLILERLLNFEKPQLKTSS